MRKDGWFSRKNHKTRVGCVLFSGHNSKMRKDASKLRNRGLNTENVQLDKGFPVVLSKIRKDGSKLRNRGVKIENVKLDEDFSVLVSKICKDVSM